MSRAAALAVLVALAPALAAACAHTAPPPPPPPPPPTLENDPNFVSIVEYEARTKELLDATERLHQLTTDHDAIRRRMEAVCVDHPEHEACDVHSQAVYAREAFCGDKEFTGHVDEVVSACHQGACKQVDEAELLTRTQYMTLVQRLPHALILFKAANSDLDTEDRKKLQHFIENVRGDEGYVIIVGRASRDGTWKKNVQYALDRAETTRRFLVEDLGLQQDRVGFITYGHPKMYLTELDAERLSEKKLTEKQANRSAFVFVYPCYQPARVGSP